MTPEQLAILARRRKQHEQVRYQGKPPEPRFKFTGIETGILCFCSAMGGAILMAMWRIWVFPW